MIGTTGVRFPKNRVRLAEILFEHDVEPTIHFILKRSRDCLLYTKKETNCVLFIC